MTSRPQPNTEQEATDLQEAPCAVQGNAGIQSCKEKQSCPALLGDVLPSCEGQSEAQSHRQQQPEAQSQAQEQLKTQSQFQERPEAQSQFQEQPEAQSQSQEQPKARNQFQEQPGARSQFQEQPKAESQFQEQPGVRSQFQEQPKAQRQSQEWPGAQSQSQQQPEVQSQEQPKSPREQTIKLFPNEDPEDVDVTQIINEHQTKTYKRSEQKLKPDPKAHIEPEPVTQTREEQPEDVTVPERDSRTENEMLIRQEDSQGGGEPESLSNVLRHIEKDSESTSEPWKWASFLPVEGIQPIPDPPLSPSRPKSPWGKLDPYNSLEDDRDYVGFATLPNQVHRKSVKKGFEFTLMVAGESGLGKSTLINSLFLTDLYKDRKLLNSEERIGQTVDITKRAVEIEEKGVKLRLTVVDTPGFGDALNNADCWKPIADYVDQQFEQYFRDESGLNRKNILDNRVHCCLYFISPFGHGLRPLDVEFLKALHERVNIVPILAKADTLTPIEVQRKKRKIREELEFYEIQIYQFPDCDSDEDEEFKQQDLELKRCIPFAVIGSNTVVEMDGKRVRGRLYPWGVVEVENPSHSDFVKLRTMLVKTHMQDLKDVMRETHYENYRAQCIQSMTRMVVKERNRNKLTRESGTDFPIQTTEEVETAKLIREKDEELRRMQEMLHKIQRQMELQ